MENAVKIIMFKLCPNCILSPAAEFGREPSSTSTSFVFFPIELRSFNVFMDFVLRVIEPVLTFAFGFFLYHLWRWRGRCNFDENNTVEYLISEYEKVFTFFQHADCLLHQFVIKCSPSEQQSFIAIGKIVDCIVEKTSNFFIVIAQQIVSKFPIRYSE